MAAVRALAAAGALALFLAGCGLIPARSAPARTLRGRPAPPSALTVIVNPSAPGTAHEVGSLLAVTARPGERVFVIDASSDQVLASSAAPPVPILRVPGPPAGIPAHATSFQRARWKLAMAAYQVSLRHDGAQLRLRQRQTLAAWAASVAARVAHALSLRPAEEAERRLGPALNKAAAQLSSLLLSGQSVGNRNVIAILGIGAASAGSPPRLPGGLQGCTVVVSSFPGDGDDEARWQASLLQARAARVVLLTPATGTQLPSVVREGLDGAITITLTRQLFASGQHKLLPAAIPRLRGLVRLLTVHYPHAVVVVNGYTDDLPVSGGNLRLSRERARAVEAWLIRHNIAPNRLQAFGYGATDPIAPNLPSGQPLNRRVIVVIDPAVQTLPVTS